MLLTSTMRTSISVPGLRPPARRAGFDWIVYRLLQTGTGNPARPGVYRDYAADWDLEFTLSFRPDA
jgi:hypothetical protein